MNINVTELETTEVERQGDPEYAMGKLHEAVHALAVGKGDVRSRLIEAHRILYPVSQNDFPKDLVDDWIWIEKEWTKSGPKLRPDGTVFTDEFKNTLDRMKNAERVEVATRILSLAEALRVSIKESPH